MPAVCGLTSGVFRAEMNTAISSLVTAEFREFVVPKGIRLDVDKLWADSLRSH